MKHDREDIIHDRISSLIDDICADKEDDREVEKGEDEWSEFGHGAGHVLSGPQSGAEPGEKHRSAGRDSEDIEGMGEGTSEAGKTEDELSEIERKIEDVIREFKDVEGFDEEEPDIIQSSEYRETAEEKIEENETRDDADEDEKKEIEVEIEDLSIDSMAVQGPGKGYLKPDHLEAGIKNGTVITKKEDITERAAAVGAEREISKDGIEESRKKPIRPAYVVSGILIILVSALTLTVFRPAGDFKKNKFSVISRQQQREQTAQKHQPVEIMPPGKEVRYQEPGPAELNAETSPQKVFRETIAVRETEAEIDVAHEINTFLEEWKNAWQNTAGEKGDIERYMSFYSRDFTSGEFDKNRWKSDKEIKNRRKEWIRVELKDITLTEPLADNHVEVSFLQVYKSSNFSDESNKTLVLKKEKTGWKIFGIKK